MSFRGGVGAREEAAETDGLGLTLSRAWLGSKGDHCWSLGDKAASGALLQLMPEFTVAMSTGNALGY